MIKTPRAMILAAGYGSRLADLGKARPKPMLPVSGAPLVRWSVLWLRHHGVRQFVINLHHLGEQIEAELGDGRELGVEIVYSREHGQILGTGGALRQARPLLDDGTGTPIVIVNAKILVDLDLQAVLQHHHRCGGEATMVLRPDADAARWGSLQVDDQQRIVRLLGATPRGGDREPVSPPLMFTGIHIIKPTFIDRVPPQGEQCVIRTAYRSLFDEGEGLYGFTTDRYWWEHSTAERYLQGVANVLEGRVPLPFAGGPIVGISSDAHIDASAQIVPPVWIGPRTRIEAGATVGPSVQLEAGVEIAAGVRVERAIVWAGRVTADTCDQVVVDAG